MSRATTVVAVAAALTMAAAACGGATAPRAGESAIPPIAAYPPVPNDAPPGASPAAVAAAAAIERGVNFGNMLDAPREGAWGLSVTQDLIDQAAAAGFRSVRLPVRWSNHAATTAPFAIDPAFLARVEWVVDRLLEKGFVVVLNMHHYRQLDGEFADSDEAVVASAAVDVRFVVLWEQIAARFRDRGDRLLFELYNEPHGRLNGESWNLLAARALGVVRRTNPTRVVVLGPTSWNSASDLRLLRMPNDPHLVATVHNYAPFRFTHQGAEWVSPRLPTGVTCCASAQLAELTAPLDIAQAWSASARYPVFVGEFGAYGKADLASRVAFTRAMRDAMEARGLSWTYWEFAAGFGVYDPATRAFVTPLLDALLR